MLHQKVPWSKPDISEDEERAVLDVIQSRWLGMGPQTRQFENDICHFIGAKNSVVVNNGTSALITALLANGIDPGDEVIVPTFTFIATVNSVLAIGAKPILVDCDPLTFNAPITLMRQAIADHPKAKAIIFVDVAGMPADIDEMRELAANRNIALIEDAAEAFGAKYKNKILGAYDHTTIFSFHIAKQITTVEGGAVVTDNYEVAERSRLIRSHGEGEHKYFHTDLGLNFRPTDIQSSIGIVQLKKVDKYIALREKAASIYMSLLDGRLTFQQVPEYVKRHPYMLFLSQTKNPEQRDILIKFLNNAGVDTRIPWPPVHVQPYHKRRLGDIRCPNADRVYERMVSLPIGNSITEEEVTFVADQVRQFYRQIE
jgi:perosamine synthetase